MFLMKWSLKGKYYTVDKHFISTARISKQNFKYYYYYFCKKSRKKSKNICLCNPKCSFPLTRRPQSQTQSRPMSAKFWYKPCVVSVCVFQAQSGKHSSPQRKASGASVNKEPARKFGTGVWQTQSSFCALTQNSYLRYHREWHIGCFIMCLCFKALKWCLLCPLLEKWWSIQLSLQTTSSPVMISKVNYFEGIWGLQPEAFSFSIVA